MGKSLAERAVLYHRHFPSKKVTTQKLSSFYAEHGIRRKVLRKRKSLGKNYDDELPEMLKEAW